MCLALRKTDRRRRSVATGRRKLRRVRLARRSLRTSVFMLIMSSSSACRGLTGLEAYYFACVPDAFSVVRVGGPEGPDVGCNLADSLLIDARDGDPGGLWCRDRDASRRLDDDGVREAEAQLEVLTLHLAAEADAMDLEVLDEALRNACDGVGDEGPRQAVLGPFGATVTAATDVHDARVDVDVEAGVDLYLESALGALDIDDAIGACRGFDTLGKRDW